MRRSHNSRPSAHPRTPGFRYPGAKIKMAPWVVSHFPSGGETYFEPFAGRANVFFCAATRTCFRRWWLNDMRTVPFLRAVQRVNIDSIPSRRIDKSEADWPRRAIAGDPVALALEPYMTYDGIGFSEGGTFTGTTFEIGDRMKNRIATAQNLLRKARLTSIDVNEFDWAQLGPADFVYLDPPYVDKDLGAYGFKDIDHERLLDSLLSASFHWILSDLDNEMYRRRLGPPTARIVVPRTGGRSKSFAEMNTECLWDSKRMKCTP